MYRQGIVLDGKRVAFATARAIGLNLRALRSKRLEEWMRRKDSLPILRDARKGALLRMRAETRSYDRIWYRPACRAAGQGDKPIGLLLPERLVAQQTGRLDQIVEHGLFTGQNLDRR